jgi:hypothetical protein
MFRQESDDLIGDRSRIENFGSSLMRWLVHSGPL